MARVGSLSNHRPILRQIDIAHDTGEPAAATAFAKRMFAAGGAFDLAVVPAAARYCPSRMRGQCFGDPDVEIAAQMPHSCGLVTAIVDPAPFADPVGKVGGDPRYARFQRGFAITLPCACIKSFGWRSIVLTAKAMSLTTHQ